MFSSSGALPFKDELVDPGEYDPEHPYGRGCSVAAIGASARSITNIQESVLLAAKTIPDGAVLFDNGASIHCAKTLDGCLPGLFLADDDDDEISVGDANSALASQGSYLYTITFTDKRGTHKDMLLRRYHTGIRLGRLRFAMTTMQRSLTHYTTKCASVRRYRPCTS